MKKFTMILMMTISLIISVPAQNNDFVSNLLQSAYQLLESGDIERAEKAYQFYKEDSGRRDTTFEKKLREKKQGSSTPTTTHSDAESYYNRAESLYADGDYTAAVEWYRRAADLGHADAQNSLGLCYEVGRGVDMDKQEAVRWYKKAAEQGERYAQCNLGFCYEEGIGVSVDYYEAVKWYRKAAEQGDEYAKENLRKLGY